MAEMPDLAGASHLVLVPGVAHLDPESAVFEAMLAGWARQQRTRFLKERDTIGPRLALVRRLAEFANQYPWEWEPAEAEAFITHLRSPDRGGADRGVDGAAVRDHAAVVPAVRTDPRYGWSGGVRRAVRVRPVAGSHEWNTVAHVTEYEGRPAPAAADLRRGAGAVRRGRRAGGGASRTGAARARWPRCGTRRC